MLNETKCVSSWKIVLFSQKGPENLAVISIIQVLLAAPCEERNVVFSASFINHFKLVQPFFFISLQVHRQVTLQINYFVFTFLRVIKP